MIPLTGIAFDVRRDRVSQMACAERDHAVEALLFDGAHESFSVGVRIRRPNGVCMRRIPASFNRSRTDAPQLRIAVTDQRAMVEERTLPAAISVRTT